LQTLLNEPQKDLKFAAQM